MFEGMVIGMHRGGARATFTVRKVSFGQGVERIFPLHSPIIDKIDVCAARKVRRAKLYFLRDLKGKAARMKEQKRRPEDAARSRRRWPSVRAFTHARERDPAAWASSQSPACDEVGRGCLAGPVVAAAVVLDPGSLHPRHLRFEDASRRSSASGSTSGSRGAAVAWAVAAVEPRRNRSHQHPSGSLRAMQRAVLALVPLPDFVLVDAFRIPDLLMAQRPVIARRRALHGHRGRVDRRQGHARPA